MKVEQLIDVLQEMNQDAEVRLMTQPDWPFEYSIDGLWTSIPGPGNCRECGLSEIADAHHSVEGHEFELYNEFVPYGGDKEVVYILEGRQLGYGTKSAWFESVTW